MVVRQAAVSECANPKGRAQAEEGYHGHHSAPGGIGRRPSDEAFRPIVLICRPIAATRTRETTWGANSDDIGLMRWVTSPRRAPTWGSGQATSFGRYQLNSRIETERLPRVAGNRKSSTAANNHGVLWKCACAEKNLPGRRGSATPYVARQSLSIRAEAAAALMPWPNRGLYVQAASAIA